MAKDSVVPTTIVPTTIVPTTIVPTTIVLTTIVLTTIVGGSWAVREVPDSYYYNYSTLSIDINHQLANMTICQVFNPITYKEKRR